MLIHSVVLGGAKGFDNFSFSASFRIKRSTTHERPTWVENDEYASYGRPCLAVPAPLWDWLHSGMGLRFDAVRCRKCGEIDHAGPVERNERGEQMRRLRLCTDCCFWRNRALAGCRKPDRLITVAGACYFIGDENQREGAFRGFGGARHRIRFLKTGRVVESTNLWFNGRVPELWRNFLPDTAEFLHRDGHPASGQDRFTGDASAPDDRPAARSGLLDLLEQKLRAS